MAFQMVNNGGMKMLSVCLVAVALMPSVSRSSESIPRWLVELSDESHLYVKPCSPQLAVKSAALAGIASIPVDFVQSVEKGKNGEWVVSLSNGDRISGTLAKESIEAETVVGRIALPVEEIARIEAVEGDPNVAEVLPAPHVPQVEFADFRWDLWRTGWEVVDGNRLASMRSVRPGFAYGHWANGRGGMAITGNGDESWTDYELTFDFKMLPANREFFHAYIPGESRGMVVYFRAESLTESWNEPDTAYGLALNPAGSWSLIAYDGWHMPGSGWKQEREGTMEILASGTFDVDREKFGEGSMVLRVEGNVFQAWLNDESLFEFTHEGGETEPIAFGGFGVQWRYESMGWIENLSVEKFPRHAALGDVDRGRR